MVRLARSPAGRLGGAAFSSAVFEYANPSKAGVTALGGLVVDESFTDPYLKRSAAHALRNIHTREAVPYLAAMLSSPDP